MAGIRHNRSRLLQGTNPVDGQDTREGGGGHLAAHVDNPLKLIPILYIQGTIPADKCKSEDRFDEATVECIHERFANIKGPKLT